MIRLFSIIFIILSVNLNAQKKTYYEHYSYPLEDYYKPLTIRVNAILLKRDDGSGSFDLKNEEEKGLFMEYIDHMNYVYSNFQNPPSLEGCYTGTDFIKDAKVRFEFNVIEIKSSYYWNYLNSGSIPEEKKYIGFSPSEKWYLTPLDDSIFNSNIPKGINVYFTENGKRFDDLYKKKADGYDLAGNMAGQFPTQNNLKRSSQIHVPNLYMRYFFQRYQATKNSGKSWEVTKTWWISPFMSHEMGHDFGLGHSSEYYNLNGCKYSIMTQIYNDPQNWLPPTEIKRIHANLTRTNLMQFVTPESHYGVTWKIDKDTIWDKPRRFYNNFEIGKGITLTISDSIILPPQSFVKLQKNAKIILKGKGKITNALGQNYINFEKHRTSAILRE